MNNKSQGFSSINKTLATLTHNMKQQKRICRTIGANDLKSIPPASHKDYSRLARTTLEQRAAGRYSTRKRKGFEDSKIELGLFSSLWKRLLIVLLKLNQHRLLDTKVLLKSSTQACWGTAADRRLPPFQCRIQEKYTGIPSTRETWGQHPAEKARRTRSQYLADRSLHVDGRIRTW